MVSRFHLTALLLFLGSFTPSFSQTCDCVSTGNCPVPITDNGTYCGVLNVDVDGPNDLGTCPLTSVCFTITHTWIGDLSATLTSPGGESYILMADDDNNFGGCGDPNDGIDVCFVPGTNNPLTNNTAYPAGSAGPCPAGTCYLTGNWTLACGGVTDPVTNVPQSPNCDLDDFNTPGSPANGSWTLCINDVCNMDTGTLDNFSLTFSCGTESCIVCEADGGQIDTTTIRSCVGNPNLLLTLPPDYGVFPPPNPTDYDYAYVISQGGIILEYDTASSVDMTGQPAGTYQIHGLSYWVSDSSDLDYIIGLDTALLDTQLMSTTAPFCGDLSSTSTTVIIEPIPAPTIIDTTLCVGECVLVGGNPICTDSTITLMSWLGCDSVIQVTITEIDVVVSISPASAPTLTCVDPTAVLDGSASTPGSVTFEWIGPNGFNETTASVTVDEPGTYTLVVTEGSTNPTCTASASIEVLDGLVSPELSVGAIPPLCNGGNFDLNTLVINDLNATNPVITFHDNTPATPANELSNTVISPSANTTYYVLATSGNCTDEEAIPITVSDPPTADFNTDGPTCSTGMTTVTYTGTGGAGANFTWNFGGGTASPGTGSGPHTVTWPTAGTFNITLTVEENGCTSTAFAESIEVEAPLPPPVISCNTTTSSVEFIWNTIPGAVDYTLNVLSGHTGLQVNGDTTFLVSGLSPNETVTIEAIAISGGVCGNSSAQQTCTAQDCPPVTVDIDPVADICLTPSSAPFDLNVTVNGGDGTGVLAIHGDGIIESTIGTFDPQSAIIGANSITATYTQGNCLFTGSLTINVFQTPTTEFTATSGLCEGDASSITYNGTAPSGSVFNWDFNGGNAVPGTGPGPHTVTWPSAGSYTVSLSVDGPGACSSTTETSNVTIDAPLASPVINCVNIGTDQVSFSWAADPNAADYIVTSISGQTLSNVTATSATAAGLSPNESVTIEVEVVSASACGNVSVQQTCTAQDCPPVTIDIDPVSSICTEPTTVPFNISTTITGTSPSGTLVWSGPGISNTQTGEFDPLQANDGDNVVTVTYTEGTCVFTESITIEVYETPQGSITADEQICLGNSSLVTFDGDPSGLIFDWNWDGGIPTNIGTGVEGPYEVTWSSSGDYTVSLILYNPNGCFMDNISVDVEVSSPIQVPIINCEQTTDAVEFTWNISANATDYDVVVLSGQTPVSSTLTSIRFENLAPEEEVIIELTVSNSGACPPVPIEAACSSLPCPGIDIVIDPVADFCLGSAAPVQLNVNIMGSDGSGSGTWGGPGVDPTTGLFDPMSVVFGPQLITYSFSEQGCSYEASTTINVFGEPTADFTADAIICMAESATVTFNGTAGPNATYNWDVDGGIAVPGTGPGPHTVTWNTAGTKSISLTVEENGCTSQLFFQDVQVDEELPLPNITCVLDSITTESVFIIWDEVPDATFTVDVMTGQIGFEDNTSILFENLSPGEIVEIQVSLSGMTSCPSTSATISCQAELCPPYIIDIEPVNPICLDGNSTQIQLEANVTGGTGNGTITWSGNGVVDEVNGIFDPSLLGPGDYPVTATFTDANCVSTNETIVSLMPPPVADAGEDHTLSCWESEAEYRLGGEESSTGNNIQYHWTANFGDFPDNESILYPTVDMPGIYTLTVTNTLVGCSSSDEVTIFPNQDLPVPVIGLNQISCQGENDGMATIESVSGGTEPFLFSLNGSPYVEADTFPFLQPGDYQLAIIDAAGCEDSLEFTIEPPSELSIELTSNLVGRPITNLGDPIQLTTISSLPLDELDSIQWTPADLLDCTFCLDPLATPTEETEFTVTVFHNGCEVTDQLNVFVEFDNPIYVPNIFSPNGDGINDFFTLFPGPSVTEVNKFLVFDRWGELVYEYEDFIAGNPASGWDGNLDGKPLNSQVFVWFAEITLVDGSTKLLEGDVTLVR